MQNKNVTTAQTFAEDNDIPQKSMIKLVNKIASTCSSLKVRIQDENKAKRSSPAKAKATTTPRRSPTKPALRELPSRDSAQKRKLSSVTALDRVESDVDMFDTLAPETPTKRRKAESPSKAMQSSSPCKPVLPPTPSSSRVKLDTDVEMTALSAPQKASSLPSTPRRSQRTKSAPQVVVADPPMDADDHPSPLFSAQEESDEAELPRRRFRPVYLDHKQWYSRDSRLNRIWRQGEKHKQNMVELYGHPLKQLFPTVERGRPVAH
jgi:hypothetical protein